MICAGSPRRRPRPTESCRRGTETEQVDYEAELAVVIDWYALVVGIEPTRQFEGGAWLSNDAANHRPALLTIPGMEDDPDKIRHTGATREENHRRAYSGEFTPEKPLDLRLPEAVAGK